MAAGGGPAQPGRAGQRAVQVGAGEHEAVVIDGDVLQPPGGGGGACKAGQAPAWLVAVGLVVARAAVYTVMASRWLPPCSAVTLAAVRTVMLA